MFVEILRFEDLNIKYVYIYNTKLEKKQEKNNWKIYKFWRYKGYKKIELYKKITKLLKFYYKIKRTIKIFCIILVKWKKVC